MYYDEFVVAKICRFPTSRNRFCSRDATPMFMPEEPIELYQAKWVRTALESLRGMATLDESKDDILILMPPFVAMMP
jgi:hypothetical protein